MRLLPRLTLPALLAVACGSSPAPFAFSASSHGVLATASAGSVAGAVFGDDEQLVFRRLPGTASEVLAPLPSRSPAERALATDGQRFVACWAEEPRVFCGSAGGGSRLEVEGYGPTLAYDSGTWLLSYQDKDGVGVLQRLGDDGRPLGDALRPFSTTAGLVSVGASNGGFAVVGGAPLRLKRLRSDLSPLGPELTLDDRGAVIWKLSVAASGSRVVVSHQRAYGNTLYVIDGDRLVRHFFLDGGSKPGLDIALAAEEDSIVAAWAGGFARWTFAATAAPFEGLPRVESPTPQGEVAGVVGLVHSEGKWMRVELEADGIDLTPLP